MHLCLFALAREPLCDCLATPRQRILRHIAAPEGEVLKVKAIGAARKMRKYELPVLLRLAADRAINPFQLAMPALWSGSRSGL